MFASAKLTYMTPDVFGLGGIQTYNRYQIMALRELLGEPRCRTISMHGPQAGGFDEPFQVDFAAGGTEIRHKVRFVLGAARRLSPGGIYWAALLHYAPVAWACARASVGTAVVNIYGYEMWTRPKRIHTLPLSRSWIISDCHATLDHAVERGMVDRSRSAVIWDPVDLNRLNPGPVRPEAAEALGLENDGRFRVLFLARMSRITRYKGQEPLLRAFAAANLPPTSELVYAGAGDLIDDLRVAAHELGIADRVKFLGRVPDAYLTELYRMASVFALVSRKQEDAGEGVPLTPLEAAACGVPIIVGNEDGSREAAVDGESGFVIRSRDQQSLIERLEQLANNADLRQRMGAAALERMQTHFSYPRFVAQHRDFLNRIGAETLPAAQRQVA